MTELDKLMLNKEQVQKLKYRILEYQEEERAEQRDFYNSQELIELFRGEEVDRKLILREAKKIIEEEKEKKEKFKVNLGLTLTTILSISLIGALAVVSGTCTIGKVGYHKEDSKYESIFNKRTELAYDNSLVKKLTTE